MKKLIIVRHGAYGEDGQLSREGREQIEVIAEKLQPHVTGRALILTSTAPRAIGSAEILSRALGFISMEGYRQFWSDEMHHPNNRVALILIQEKSAEVDTLIVVTHYEYAEYLPVLFAKEVLSLRIAQQELNKGECRVISCEEKTDIILRPFREQAAE